MKKILTTIGLLLAIFTLTSMVAYSYSIPSELKPINEPFDINYNEGKIQGVSATILILQIIAGGLLYFAAPVAIVMIVWGATNMVIGGAETEKVEQAKKHLTWSVVGLLLIIFSYAFVRFIISFVVEAASTAT